MKRWVIDPASVPPFDEDLRDRGQWRFWQRRDAIHARYERMLAIWCNENQSLLADWFAEQQRIRRAFYESYIRSPEWRAKRKLVFERDRYQCQQCHERRAEQVHHLTYMNLGDEPLEDLVSVCNRCHMTIHGRDDFTAWPPMDVRH